MVPMQPIFSLMIENLIAARRRVIFRFPPDMPDLVFALFIS